MYLCFKRYISVFKQTKIFYNLVNGKKNLVRMHERTAKTYEEIQVKY